MDLQHLRASDGTGEAVLAHISSPRTAGSTVLELDNVDNWNTKCVVVTGTPNANGFIATAGMKVMYGHITAGDFIIDGYAPGYVDNGNLTTEVAIVKMTTNWADTLVDLLENVIQDDGFLKPTALDDFYKPSELVFDHVASGCVLTGTGYGSTLAWSLTAGVVYINGRRYTVAAATGVVVATKDTYFDLLMPASGSVATLVYTGGNSVANNAASPALAANSVRIGIIVSGGNIASVAAINQGQEDKVLPIASSVPYTTTDSLGNLICPRDPNRKVLGYRRRKTNFTTTSITAVQIPELSCPVIIPAGRKVRVTAFVPIGFQSVNANGTTLSIWEGTVASGTLLNFAKNDTDLASYQNPLNTSAVRTPASTNITYNAGFQTGGGTGTAGVVFTSLTGEANILVELV